MNIFKISLKLKIYWRINSVHFIIYKEYVNSAFLFHSKIISSKDIISFSKMMISLKFFASISFK